MFRKKAYLFGINIEYFYFINIEKIIFYFDNE